LYLQSELPSTSDARWLCPLESEEAPVEDEPRDDGAEEEQDESHGLPAPPRNKFSHTSASCK